MGVFSQTPVLINCPHYVSHNRSVAIWLKPLWLKLAGKQNRCWGDVLFVKGHDIREVLMLTGRLSCLARATQRAIQTYPRREASFDKALYRRSLRRLKDNTNIIKKHDVRVVEVPETGQLILLKPCCRILLSDVKAVQEIMQQVRPDQACPELCGERLSDLNDIRAELSNPKTYLKTDIAETLRRRRKGEVFEGLEMGALVLEADRHKIPVTAVDRLKSTTTARMQAAVSDELARLLLMPRCTHHLVRGAASLKLLLSVYSHADAREWVVPVETLKQLFKSIIQLPWQDREYILERSVGSEGSEAVPLSVLADVLQRRKAANERRKETSLEDLKVEAMMDRLKPMPAHIEPKVGPESCYDIFARVISSERDDVLAYNLRTKTGQTSN